MARKTVSRTTLKPALDDTGAPRGPGVALTVLHHPDMRRIGERVVLDALPRLREASLSRLAPDFCTPGATAARPLEDPFLSRTPLWLTLDAASPLALSVHAGGTEARLEGEPLRGTRALTGEQLARGVTLELAGRVLLLLHLHDGPETPLPELGLAGRSGAMEALRADILKVADLPTPVLIRGETGSGKELVARAIHQASPRAGQPCVCVNMGAIAPTTAVSELLGHVRGAFTGADRHHVGYIGQADGGTLFLDEVGETPGDVQATLLRVLETQELQPVGGTRPSRVDVRVIAATDANLEHAVASGDFKHALFHRLAGFRIHVPPLRARRDDIGRLVLHFLEQELAQTGELHHLAPRPPGAPMWLPTAVMDALVRYRWPGNVRELRNLVRQLVVSSRGRQQVAPSDVVPHFAPAPGDAAGSPAPAPVGPSAPAAPLEEPGLGLQEARDAAERATLEDALRRTDQSRTEAARLLGISRRALYNKMQRLGLL